MRHVSGTQTKETEDLAHGQEIIVAARWILILSGLLFILWNPGPVSEVRIQIAVILILAAINFYLQAQILAHRPTLDTAVYAASVADIAVISLIIMTADGFASGTYIFYFPAILGIAVVFPMATAAAYVVAVISIYASLSLASVSFAAADLQVLITRLLMFAAVAVCGALYREIEANRRRDAVEAQRAPRAQIRERGAGAHVSNDSITSREVSA